MTLQYKTIRNSLLAVLLGGVVSISVFAESSSIDADATVQALAPLSLTQVNPLSWGTFTVGATGGVILMGSNDDPLVVSGNINLITGGTTGHFTISGQINQQINATIDGTVTLSNGTDTMSAELYSNLNHGTGSTLGLPANITDTLDPSGNSGDFRTYGELTVSDNQPAGLYTGLINVTFDYL